MGVQCNGFVDVAELPCLHICFPCTDLCFVGTRVCVQVHVCLQAASTRMSKCILFFCIMLCELVNSIVSLNHFPF